MGGQRDFFSIKASSFSNCDADNDSNILEERLEF